MRKGKRRSEESNRAVSSAQVNEEIKPPLDDIEVNILSLSLASEDPTHYAIEVTFSDQLILSGVILSEKTRDVDNKTTKATGIMSYDPSDYVKMSLFADSPLVVTICPLNPVSPSSHEHMNISNVSVADNSIQTVESTSPEEKSSCIVDILSLFIDTEAICVKKRLQPIIKPSILNQKSWENLPLIVLEIKVTRNPVHAEHHEVLKAANYMKITIVAAYNLIMPYDEQYVYTAATKTPLPDETKVGTVTYNQGFKVPKRFHPSSFHPQWESLRIAGNIFTENDEKFLCKSFEFQNNHNIDLDYYLKQTDSDETVWASFHRTLMLGQDIWLWKHLRSHKWPLEVHINGDKVGYSFMAFLDLFKLLYPGEDKILLAVPLQWVNAEEMWRECGCDLLLPPNTKLPFIDPPQKATKNTSATSDSGRTGSTRTDKGESLLTGADGGPAFVIVEVKLARSLKKPVIPPIISTEEIHKMLKEMEEGCNKRKCTGRGQMERYWQSTVLAAAASLRRVPHYGMTDFCTFNRQLSESRTRVELHTSLCLDAAVCLNNLFCTHDFLDSDEKFEELVTLAHASLVRSACGALVSTDEARELETTLRSARHARQLQEYTHAVQLYLQLVTEHPYDSDCWRELSTCLNDVNPDWAEVCINEAICLNPRHPLNLVSKGCMLFEEDVAAADTFFSALLALHPFWTPGLLIVSVYYRERELFCVADEILDFIKKNKLQQDLSMDQTRFPRSWESELGDWWDNTPLLPGMNQYYDAADLLLRIRSTSLAEACLARSLLESNETAAYYHLVALCCRLKGSLTDTLCQVKKAIEQFGEVSYLRSLEAECLHKMDNIGAAMLSYEKAGYCGGPYSTLLSLPSLNTARARSVLVDLLHWRPSAYAWMALAYDWIKVSTTDGPEEKGATTSQTGPLECAVACAAQALKWDRWLGEAWALLARHAIPRVRRQYYRDMATGCGYNWTEEDVEDVSSEQSVCNKIGYVIKECLA